MLTDSQIKKLAPDIKAKYKKHLQYQIYYRDPAKWLEDRSQFTANEYQKEILGLVAQDKPINEISIRACRGAGKTFTTACTIAWFIDVHETLGIDWAVQTTAPSQRVLANSLWREIHKTIGNLSNTTDKSVKPLKMRYEGKYGVAVSQTVAPGQEVNLEGMHASRMLIVLDEAKGVTRGVFESLRGSYSEAGVGDNKAIVMAISTPPKISSGMFFDIHTKRDIFSNWEVYHITQQQALEAGRISQESIDHAKKYLGENSARYQADWLGEFATETKDAWLPPGWIEESNERWEGLKEEGLLNDGGPMIIGLDVAGRGSDKAAIAIYNPRCNAIVEIQSEDYTENVMDLIPWALKHGRTVVVDSDSMGYGLMDAYKRHQEVTGQDYNLIEFRGGMSSKGWTDPLGNQATNIRSAAYCNLHSSLLPADDMLALPPDDDLKAEIFAQAFVEDAVGGKVKLEGKDRVRKRLGRSPDLCDAVIMALWEPPELGHEYLPPVSVVDIRNRAKW